MPLGVETANSLLLQLKDDITYDITNPLQTQP